MAAPSDNSAALKAALKHIEESSNWQTQETCYVTLLKLLGNVVEHPAEAKFRLLKLTNAALKAKVFDVVGAKDMLLVAGFREMADGEAFELPAALSGSYVAAVRDALQQHANQAKLNELRRERDERIAAAKEEATKHNKYSQIHAHLTPEQREEVQRQLAIDRAEFEKDREMHPVFDSHGKELKFGATEGDASYMRKGGS